MLSRVAGIGGSGRQAVQAESAVAVEAVAGRSPLSAAALANLRAEVLLRLVDILLKQIQRGPDGRNAARNMLEALFNALKTTPIREDHGAESGRRKLAGLLTRLPVEARPAVERLLNATLQVLPTRVLVEIIRNPNGPEARKFAADLLETALPEEDRPSVSTGERSPRFPRLEAQLSILAKPDAKAASGDSHQANVRVLQAALEQLFEPEAESASPAHAEANSETPAAIDTERGESSVETPLKGEAGGIATDKSVSQEPKAKPTAVTGDAPERRAAPAGNGTETARQITRLSPGAEMIATVRSPSRIGDAAQATVARLIMDIVANLNEDETRVLKAILEAPLPAAGPEDAETVFAEHDGPENDRQERSVATAADDLPPAGEQADGLSLETNLLEILGTEPETLPGDADAVPPEVASTEAGADSATDIPFGTDDARSVDGNIRKAELFPHPVSAQVETENSKDVRPAVVAARDGMPPQVEARLDTALPQIAVREGIPYAFVPYLPVAEELDDGEAVREEEDSEEDEPSDTDERGSGEDPSPENDNASDASAAEDDSVDGRRRRRIAEMSGIPDPGSIFYQKLGDYWA